MTGHNRSDAIQAVAYLVRRVRPDWARPDIENTLLRIPTTVTLPRIAVAAITAAETAPPNAGPGYINAHWQPFPTPTADYELTRQHEKRLREEHEWAKAAKPTPQRIKDLRHLARHGITPTSAEAHNWLHHNTVTITLTVPDADAATYQQLIRETTQAFTNHESPEA